MRGLMLCVVTGAVLGCSKKSDREDLKFDGTPSTPVKTITGGWREFSSTTYGFRVSFPWGTPIERPILLNWTPPTLGERADFSTTQWDGNRPTYGFSIIAFRYRPRTSASDRTQAMDEVIQQTVLPRGAKLPDYKPVTWAGQSAQEALIEAANPPPGGKNPRKVLRQLVTETAGYVGIVHDDGDLTPREIAQFFESFQLLPATGAKSSATLPPNKK